MDLMMPDRTIVDMELTESASAALFEHQLWMKGEGLETHSLSVASVGLAGGERQPCTSKTGRLIFSSEFDKQGFVGALREIGKTYAGEPVIFEGALNDMSDMVPNLAVAAGRKYWLVVNTNVRVGSANIVCRPPVGLGTRHGVWTVERR